ncbi:hypothetical protein [Aquimarina algicola]|uniref:Uncharacterized protein n=1 Tax=Aquimarina algicola TaxID=2589995 RepID=A0A504IXM3_9FLAO|nr:hypothetical protein [Aquimarina algicola]TPN82804.1 hypothetical protein FHK87_20470 [Aquimarina algicola]
MKDQVRKVDNSILSDIHVSFKTRIIGTIFIVFSGLLLYLDKFFGYLGFESEYTFGYSNFSNFIWAFMQSIAPVLMILGMYMKPYKISFFVAIYCYGLQLIWIFSPQHSDNFLGYVFAIGICIFFVFLVFVIKRLIFHFEQKKNKDQEFIQDAKDVLEILKARVLEGNG